MSRLVSFASALLLAIAPGLRAEPPEAALDLLYGAATPPAYVKQYEADYQGKVLLNPYLQVASREHPAVLEPGVDGYKWVIDVAGRVAILREVPHPLGRTYPRGFHRPEDDSDREPGYVETYGHVSALGWRWEDRRRDPLVRPRAHVHHQQQVRRYTKSNADRPEQLSRPPGSSGGRRPETRQGPAHLLDYAPAGPESLFRSPSRLRRSGTPQPSVSDRPRRSPSRFAPPDAAVGE